MDRKGRWIDSIAVLLYTAPQLIAYSKGQLSTLELSTMVKSVNRCVCLRDDLSRSVLDVYTAFKNKF